MYPGRDSLVRVVDVRTEENLYRRAIHILCLLDSPEEKTDEQNESTQSVLGEHVPANIISV